MIGRLNKNTLKNIRTIRGDKYDKWLIPPYIFDDEVPTYLSGYMFAIPRWSIPCLIEAMWSSPIVMFDDFHFAGILAKACNVERKANTLWNGHEYPLIAGNEVENIKFDSKYVMWHLGYTKYGSKCKHRFYEAQI